MKSRSSVLLSRSFSWLPMGATAVLLGCGGGSSIEPPTSGPEVTSVAISTPRYEQTLTFTIVGERLDEGLSVLSTHCELPKRMTDPPFVSGATVAYYQCPPLVGVGPGQLVVTRTSDGTTLSTTDFTVPLPEVTLTVSNGLGVSGDIVIGLRPDKKPATVGNFLDYVRSGFYVGTIFHYVFPDFTVQGGGYLPYAPDMPRVLKPAGPPIGVENDRGNHLSNLKWTVAAAQTSLYASTSQFLFHLEDQTFLDDLGGGNALVVFGSIIGGTEVVTAIAGAPCAPTSYDPGPACLPFPNVVITDAKQTR